MTSHLGRALTLWASPILSVLCGSWVVVHGLVSVVVVEILAAVSIPGLNQSCNWIIQASAFPLKFPK